MLSRCRYAADVADIDATAARHDLSAPMRRHTSPFAAAAATLPPCAARTYYAILR